LSERPERQRPRRLADWLNPTGERKVHSLVDKIYQRKNLAVAWEKVKRNRGAGGIDGEDLAAFEAELEANLERLHQELKDGTYAPQPVLQHLIPKAGKPGEYRPLGIPTIYDRVCQQAILNRLEPIFEPIFDDANFGYRSGRSTKDALTKIWRELEAGNEWVVDADLKDFFGSVDHDKLLTLVNQRVADGRVLGLVKQILEAGCVAAGKRLATAEGVPQGGVISPLLSNILLTPFDREMRRRGFRVTRYADDCAPRRRTAGREPCVQPCCTRDGGRPPEAAVQAEASNHPLLLPLREVVVRELGKGRVRPGQVRTVESNASEPLMTCRKRRDGVKTGGESLLREKSGGNLFTAQAASGMKAARTRSRLLCGTWEPVTPMLREPAKGKPPEVVSTEAGYRGGATCSSEEGPVTGLERRGCPIRPEEKKQPAMGGLH